MRRALRWRAIPRLHFVLLAILGMLGGCAPRSLTSGVQFAADRYGVADATTVAVHRKPYLRFDAGLRADLDELLQHQPELTRDQVAELLKDANELAIRQTSDELDRMPQAGIRWLAMHYGDTENGNAVAFRGELKRQLDEEAKRALESELARLDGSRNLRQYLEKTRRSLEAAPSDRGRTTRMLLAAPFFVPAAIGAEIADAEAMRRTMVSDFDQKLEYHPPTASIAVSPAGLPNLDLPELAAFYAPVLVQQVRLDAAYDPGEDRIGRVFLTGAADDIYVNVDTSHPTVYWAHAEARIGRGRYDQLTYVCWYPGRPALSNHDVEAGKIDGMVIRITLDRHRRPAVYEFVRTCGCYHTLWVAEFVEAGARSEFGAPGLDQTFAIQKTTEGRSLFLPALVPDDGTQPRRPVVFADAGDHLVVLIKPFEPHEACISTIDEQAYELLPYESLTRLPLGSEVASMFGSDGLVHKAGRMEGLLLAPTGMLSAGQPRQLGTMKIRMDAYNHDDPRLLDKNLRFPSNF